jgi:cytochrome c553
MPIIAGQDAAYLKKQIADYAAGKRPSAEMEPYAKQVLNLGVDDVAAYFASRRREPTPVPSPADAVARGRSAAAQCAICHGPQGQGDAAKLIPSLAGQAPGYLREQMLLFKQDRRSPGDPALTALKALMKSIPDETFGDLAAYYSSLR